MTLKGHNAPWYGDRRKGVGDSTIG